MLARALPRKSAEAGEGAMRWASRTWLRCSRVQDWLSAVMEAKRRPTQRMPPEIWRVTVG